MTEDIRELSEDDFDRAISHRGRERSLRGELESGTEVIALRRLLGMTQQAFSDALGICVHTLRNWEQGRRSLDGPALALLTA